MSNNVISKTGDNGSTSLANGSRVRKISIRIEAIGCIDELNSSVGVLLSDILNNREKIWLIDIQNNLFNIGSSLALDKNVILNKLSVIDLEKQVAFMNDDLPELKSFILPNGVRAAAIAHQTRAICRRAERTIFTLADTEFIDEVICIYLNRLSDFMFVLARFLNHQSGVNETIWRAI